VCSFSPTTFQVGNVALPDVGLVRDVELRLTTPFAKFSAFSPRAILSTTSFGMSGVPAAISFRARDQARRAKVFVCFLCLGGERFILFARKDSDLALAGHFKSNVHDASF
jgi:hypothetical protein